MFRVTVRMAAQVMVGGAIADPAPTTERSVKLSLHSAPEYPGHCHWHSYN